MAVIYRQARFSNGMRRPVSTGCDTLPMIDALKAQWKGDRLIKKYSTGKG